jgi:hypothetical protein
MTKSTSRIIVGSFLILLGVALAICSRPYFSYTIESMEQVQRSEIILDYSFDLHQSQDRMALVQMAIGQTLHILASGNKNFTFLVANYTNPENVTGLAEPDVTYYMMNGTLTVNTTWGPQVRTAEPGDYYLVFLARDAPVESPSHVYTNITKKWMEIQPRTVLAPDRKSLVDSDFAFAGLGTMILGGTILVYVFYDRHRLRNRRKSRRETG